MSRVVAFPIKHFSQYDELSIDGYEQLSSVESCADICSSGLKLCEKCSNRASARYSAPLYDWRGQEHSECNLPSRSWLPGRARGSKANAQKFCMRLEAR